MTRAATPARPAGRPRLAFVGLGWIGCLRLKSVLQAGRADVVAIADPDDAALRRAETLVPGARRCGSLDDVIEARPDGIVIATPNALHAGQALRAIDRGIPVFCQKPLACSAADAARVIARARERDVLLDVDFCYRRTAAMQRIRELVAGGELGRIVSVDLTFHNAYGPDKPWFYRAADAGGGCLLDLGIHLVDLALWTLGYPAAEVVTAHCFHNGRRAGPGEIEDYAQAELALDHDTVLRLACSWNASIGADADISVVFVGTGASAALRNIGGSFYDFQADLCRKTSAEIVAMPPDAWGGRAIVAWADRLARSPRYDLAADRICDSARVVERIYEAARGPQLLDNIVQELPL